MKPLQNPSYDVLCKHVKLEPELRRRLQSTDISRCIKHMNKTAEEAERFDLIGDQEMAYLMYRRAVDIFEIIQQMVETPTNEKFKQSMEAQMFEKQATKILSETGRIAVSLKNRFSLKEQSSSPLPLDLHPLNDKPDKKYQSFISPKAIIDEVENHQMKLLVLDYRTDKRELIDYSRNPSAVTVIQLKPQNIRAGCLLQSLMEVVDLNLRQFIRNISEFDLVVLLPDADESAITVEKMRKNSKTMILLEALTTYNTNPSRKLRNSPVILEKGFPSWSNCYPCYVVDSGTFSRDENELLTNENFSKLLEKSLNAYSTRHITYPDLFTNDRNQSSSALKSVPTQALDVPSNCEVRRPFSPTNQAIVNRINTVNAIDIPPSKIRSIGDTNVLRDQPLISDSIPTRKLTQQKPSAPKKTPSLPPMVDRSNKPSISSQYLSDEPLIIQNVKSQANDRNTSLPYITSCAGYPSTVADHKSPAVPVRTYLKPNDPSSYYEKPPGNSVPFQSAFLTRCGRTDDCQEPSPGPCCTGNDGPSVTLSQPRGLANDPKKVFLQCYHGALDAILRHKHTVRIKPNSDKFRGRVGLVNLGNSCFMNAILQALFHTPGFATIFCSNKTEHFINPENRYGTRGIMSGAIAALTQLTWSGSCSIICPEIFFHLFKEYVNAKLADGSQQDAHEFQTALFDALHEETNKVDKEKRLNFEQDYDDTNLPASFVDYSHNNRRFSSSPINSMFDITWSSAVQCRNYQRCGGSSVLFESCSNINVALPPRGSSTRKLVDCLDSFFSEKEKLGGEWKCPQCQKQPHPTKTVRIWHLPDVLVVQLKRFEPSEAAPGYVKNEIEIIFDTDCFNMARFLHKQAPNQETDYILYAIVCHTGGMDHGHYFSYVKDLSEGQWYLFNDSTCKPVPQSNIEIKNAYILYYWKFASRLELPR